MLALAYYAQNYARPIGTGLSVRPLQVDSLFPISHPHPFYEPHYFVCYAFIIDHAADCMNNLMTMCSPTTVEVLCSMTDFKWPAQL